MESMWKENNFLSFLLFDKFRIKYYSVGRGKIMKRLYIDFDGVVLDTIPHLYAALEASGTNMDSESEKSRFFSMYDFDMIINDDNILNDSIECINKLIESKKFEISFLTHVNSLDEAVSKINYLRSKFNDITIIITPKEISKTKMVHSAGAILVDDYSGNLTEWENTGGIAVRFSKELESKGFLVINRLDKLLDMSFDGVDEVI